MRNEQAVFKAWARKKYHIAKDAQIECVTFDLMSRGPYSDQTPDVDPYVDVFIKYHSANGTHIVRDEIQNVHDLIRQLVEIE